MDLPREPIVAERIAAGADLVSFSGDKLLGGPQAGIVVGKRVIIAKLKANALKRALRCDKLTLAALSATLRLYLRSGNLGAEIPTLRFLTRSMAELRAMAPRARDILMRTAGADFQCEIIDSTSQIGSGAFPTEELPSIAIRITHPAVTANAIAEMFRRARPSIIGRISDGCFPARLALHRGSRGPRRHYRPLEFVIGSLALGASRALEHLVYLCRGGFPCPTKPTRL